MAMGFSGKYGQKGECRKGKERNNKRTGKQKWRQYCIGRNCAVFMFPVLSIYYLAIGLSRIICTIPVPHTASESTLRFSEQFLHDNCRSAFQIRSDPARPSSSIPCRRS